MSFIAEQSLSFECNYASSHIRHLILLQKPFGYSRKDVLLIGLGVTLAGIGLKSGLEVHSLPSPIYLLLIHSGLTSYLYIVALFVVLPPCHLKCTLWGIELFEDSTFALNFQN